MDPRFVVMLCPEIPDIGEFFDNLLQKILGGLYSGLYGKAELVFNKLFSSLNEKVTWAADELSTQDPKTWNGDAFSLVQTVAEDGLIPIASCIVVFIFCWELVRMMQESNHMQNVRADSIMMVLLKLILCLLACSKSFAIVMGFFEIGSDATKSIINRPADGDGPAIGAFGEGLKFEDVLQPVTENFQIGDVMNALIALLLLLIAWILTMAAGGFIYVRISVWFIELLMYASAAPVPFATFGNREWGQMGTNYIRKMLAISFEGFFMLMLFAIFGAVMGGIGGGDFYESVVMIIAAALALCTMLGRTSNISASIFNAH